jgi:hypothetical protein
MDRIDPSKDGIDHINIYSKGKTELGKYLSNFTYAPIKTIDGDFASIEAYWYWLNCTHPDRNILKPLYGWEAKQKGRELRGADWNESEEFKTKICEAIRIKIHSYMKDWLADSTLPFKHYYVYSGKAVEPEDGKWILEFIEAEREKLKARVETSL